MQRLIGMTMATAALALAASVAGNDFTAHPESESWDPSCGLFVTWNGWRVLPWDRGDCDEQQPFELEPCGGITYMPHPGGEMFTGYGPTALHPQTQCTFERVRRRGGALAVMIRSRSAPIPYVVDELVVGAPDAAANIVESVPDLEYMLMDLSGDFNLARRNVRRIGQLVRQSSANPRLGNYGWFPGDVDTSVANENRADRSLESQAYLESDLTVAMPSCYPIDNVVNGHLDPDCFNGPAPNPASAMFWFPLERLSIAARALPDGHELIPFVSSYICKGICDGPPPPPDTLAALIQHFRLRGADGLVIFPGSDVVQPNITDDEFEALALNAWRELDPYFLSGDAQPLNLFTKKQTGVEWSGILTPRHLVVLTTNLGSERRPTVSLPAIDDLPTSVIARQGHHLHVWERPQPSADLDNDGRVGVLDLLILLSQYGDACGPCLADLNADNLVDTADLLILLQQWTASG